MRDWLASPRIQRAALWLAALLTVGGVLGFIRHEGQVRERQFCELVIDRHVDVHKRIGDQEEFLKSPAADAPSNRGLAEYVAEISLPQLREDFRLERVRIPDVCQPELEEAFDRGRLQRLEPRAGAALPWPLYRAIATGALPPRY